MIWVAGNAGDFLFYIMLDSAATSSTQLPQDRMPVLDILRGLAALAVCLFHFGNDGLWSRVPGGFVFESGYLGVYAFFVISGFVIPHSLVGKEHTVSNYGRFLIRRFLRLQPAYVAALLVVIGLWIGSSMTPGFKGQVPHFAFHYLLTNFTLTCDFTGEPWLLVVAWTLAIEAQYYLLIGLTMPGLHHAKLWVRQATLAAWVLSSALAFTPGMIFAYCPLFVLGLALHAWSQGLVSGKYFGMIVILSVGLYFQFATGSIFAMGQTDAPLVIAVGLTTMCLIWKCRKWQTPYLVWLGMISYSIYLLHVPIGGRVMNLARRYFESDILLLAAVLSALGASILSAWLFYRLIELPAHRWARRIRLVVRPVK